MDDKFMFIYVFNFFKQPLYRKLLNQRVYKTLGTSIIYSPHRHKNPRITPLSNIKVQVKIFKKNFNPIFDKNVQVCFQLNAIKKRY